MTTEALYARVSTREQTVGQQLGRLRAAAPGAWEFVDQAFSGRSTDRPEYQRLVAEISRGTVTAVYATKLDRLGRSAKAIIGFFELAESPDVRVVLLDQQLDTSTPVGRVVRTILAGMAELESDLISERTREKMGAIKSGAMKTKSGDPIGRPRRVTPELAEKVVQLRAEGLLWREIAVRTHLPEGTCRKVPGTLRPKKPSVENGGPDFATQSAASSDLGREPS